MTSLQPPISQPPVFVALTAAGARLAQSLLKSFPGAQIHGARARVEAADQFFDAAVPHLQALFSQGRTVVGICAAGILVRALAPLLGDKESDAPVVALAEDGSVAVPLLGGHHGANELARRLAAMTGGTAAVTTAGDIRFGVSLDAPPAGWHLANPQDHKAFMAGLLAGKGLALQGEAPWLADSALPFADDAQLRISVTEKLSSGSPAELVYHPARLAIGLGCERGTDPVEALALVQEVLTGANLAPQAIAGVFSIDLKADEPALHHVATHFGVPARFFPADRLEEEAPRLQNPSEVVFQEVGCHGVAEGAALAAVGPDGDLLVAKHKSKRATCAVGLARAPLDAAAIGRPRGRVAVIGLGPGSPAWRTPEVAAEVMASSDLVGYKLYLDLLGTLTQGKTCHAYALGEEETRVRAALDLAAEGRRVALICSGDPGIYAMAALLFEVLDVTEKSSWGRLEVIVCPGISALQAAAARIGAPLGHDFCAISLSDLLTPWEVIEQRLRAAAAGDFVVAFYNPVSQRRTRQFARAVEILRAARPPETPVVLARNLGRPGETVTLKRLDEVSPADVDMLTTVLVGSSTTRQIGRGDGGAWVYTPRGYAAKRGQAAHAIEKTAGNRS